jgi:pimeloyl-ACP methyl ester carboxylesterase/DNA-binding CsgD family transcriptional regulator
MQQRIEFATAPDGARLAYATHGTGPPLVRAAHWLTHVEYDWQSPVWHPWLAALGARHTVLRYDERGCGLSDWDAGEFSLESWVTDLETVVDASGLDRFGLLGVSQGAPVAIAYAVRHPERVSHLVIYGGYLRGWRRRGSSVAQLEEHEAMVTLMRLAWGKDNPVFRRIFTQELIPDASEELMESFDELQRRTTSPENAARFESAFGDLDVQAVAPRVRVPTVVMHLDDDRTIPLEEGRRIAAAIPHARFVLLPGQNHVLRPEEAAFAAFIDEIQAATVAARATDAVPSAVDVTALTAREREIFGRVADGRSNEEIATDLGLSVRTVERHLSNGYLKLGLGGRSARAAAAAIVARHRTTDR